MAALAVRQTLRRVISSIGSYAYTENEDTLWIHLYAGGTVEKEVNGQKASVVITSGFPWNGDVTLKVESDQLVTMTVALRIPGWCGEDFELEGAVGKECRMEAGYLYVTGEWKKEDLLKLRFAMKVKVLQADSRVHQDEGKVAVMRGRLSIVWRRLIMARDFHLFVLSQMPYLLRKRQVSLASRW